eukprot:scaffold9836_cov97-Isochrysis_galbana.AAC.3
MARSRSLSRSASAYCVARTAGDTASVTVSSFRKPALILQQQTASALRAVVAHSPQPEWFYLSSNPPETHTSRADAP